MSGNLTYDAKDVRIMWWTEKSSRARALTSLFPHQGFIDWRAADNIQLAMLRINMAPPRVVFTR